MMRIREGNVFSEQIQIIGINPFVFLPGKILTVVFMQAGKDKGKIPVKMRIDGHEFNQTLIKYKGYWRLYINTPMRKAAGKDVGDIAKFEIEFDPVKREVPMHPTLKAALTANKDAKNIFTTLAPSLQSEIIRYISHIKTNESIDRNVIRAINFLLGKERFLGRDKP
ncbi:MAG: DUF1905 domain-containing protein [Chitinophagaceae bacterium]